MKEDNKILNINKNIISWYPFKKNSDILNVNIDNVSDLDNIELKYDYILIIGLEKVIYKDEKVIEKCKEKLKENGILLIAFDNKLGVKFLSSFTNRETYGKHENKKMMTLREVENLLDKLNLKKRKIYYVLPDYNCTNVIFTDKISSLKSNLSKNVVYNDKDTIKFFEQNELYSDLIEEGQFKLFSNSYLIEIFYDKFHENNIKMVSFSNMRKEKYQIKTIMKDEFVYKYANSKKSEIHINQIKENIDALNKMDFKILDKYDDNKIISKYTENETFDNIIYRLIKNAEIDKAVDLMKMFKNELYSKMIFEDCEKNVFDKYDIKYTKNDLSEMKFVKYGLWDLTFENCFYINNEFYFYDQEWIEKNLPIDFIIYRAIKYFSKIRKYIPFNKMCRLLEINENFIELFEELDNKIQEEIRDNNYWILHKQGNSVEKFVIQKLTGDHKINILNNTINELNGEIEKLNTENSRVNNEINLIYNSKYWKIFKKIRKIKDLGKIRKDKK